MIDESTASLGRLLIEGNVTFSSNRDLTLTAAAIIVRSSGTLMAGNATIPRRRQLNILLTGDASSSNILISKDVNAGSKVLAAVAGGTVGLYGQVVGLRWSKLAATAAAGEGMFLFSSLSCISLKPCAKLHDLRSRRRILIASPPPRGIPLRASPCAGIASVDHQACIR